MNRLKFVISVLVGFCCFLSISSINWAQEKIPVYEVEMYQRPPFYKGPMPLKYLEGRRFGGGIGSIDITYWHDFGSWRNEFSYSSVLILQSAKAVDRFGNLLAEARFVEIDRERRVIIFKETHYRSDGSIQFSCLSTFSIGGKIKLSEANKRGRKLQEFFFILPV